MFSFNQESMTKIKLEEKLFLCINKLNNVWSQIYFIDETDTCVDSPEEFQIIEYANHCQIVFTKISNNFFIDKNTNYAFTYNGNKIFDTHCKK